MLKILIIITTKHTLNHLFRSDCQNFKILLKCILYEIKCWFGKVLKFTFTNLKNDKKLFFD